MTQQSDFYLELLKYDTTIWRLLRVS